MSVGVCCFLSMLQGRVLIAITIVALVCKFTGQEAPVPGISDGQKATSLLDIKLAVPFHGPQEAHHVLIGNSSVFMKAFHLTCNFLRLLFGMFCKANSLRHQKASPLQLSGLANQYPIKEKPAA